MIKISVIIAAYNAESTIRRCLKSICLQSYTNLEIIVVNDGSKDSTLSKIKKIAEQDPRIVIINQENKGAGMAKNRGMAVASGDYISFVDSDDWIDKHTYEEVVEKIYRYNPDMVVFNHNRIYSDKIQKNVRGMKEELIELDKIGRNKYISKYMISYNHEFGAWNKVVRRSLIALHNIGFSDNKTTVYDDNLYCLKLICHAETIYSIPKAFYNYVILKGSVSDMDNTYKKLAIGYSNLFDIFIKYLKRIDMYREFAYVLPYLYYSMVYFGLIRIKHFAHKDVSDVFEELSKFYFYKPFMKEMNNIVYRCKNIILSLSGMRKISNWQVNGLLILTIIQGGVITHYAMEDNYSKIERYI